MKKIISYLALSFLTTFSLTIDLAATASSCNNNFNKITKVECLEKNVECNSTQDKKNELNNAVGS